MHTDTLPVPSANVSLHSLSIPLPLCFLLFSSFVFFLPSLHCWFYYLKISTTTITLEKEYHRMCGALTKARSHPVFPHPVRSRSTQEIHISHVGIMQAPCIWSYFFCILLLPRLRLSKEIFLKKLGNIKFNEERRGVQREHGSWMLVD